MYVLRSLGFDASGLEPDQQYARHAREVLGVPVATGFIQDAAFPAASFDVVTMYHALEHVEDPSSILSRLRGWIVESGVLLIEVPNVEAVCIAPKHRFHFAHFYNFNRDVLEALGRKAGFEPVETTTSADGGNLISVFRAVEYAQPPRTRSGELRSCGWCGERPHAAEVLHFDGAICRSAEPAANVSDRPESGARVRNAQASPGQVDSE